MRFFGTRALRASLLAAVSIPTFLAFEIIDVSAQETDLGSVKVAAAPKPVARKKVRTVAARPTRVAAPAARSAPVRTRVAVRPVVRTAAIVAVPVPVLPVGLPVTSEGAVGRSAPAGSAPALAPSQAPLNSFEPKSIVSDKIIRDVVMPGADYNDTAKFTPGFVSNNSNGVGDSKSGWRGYKDGQFNITFDGIPFGDANDPTHHSAAYFPGAFLSRVDINRGPGAASQIGYATFGGTLGLFSLDFKEKFGASVQASAGNFGTYTTSAEVQSGYDKATDARGLVAVSHIQTNGVIQYGDSSTWQGLLKVEKNFGEVKVTALATGGTEKYTNINSITRPQLLAYGKDYGQVNNNPLSQQYRGFNNSLKATDMEYIRAEWDIAGFKFDNTAYTYSYWYPRLQNNGADQNIEGNSSIANGGTIVSVKIPQPNGTSNATPIIGVAPGDVTGFYKDNSYRAIGDILKVSKNLDIPFFAGKFTGGVWYESIDNHRAQPYVDYTKGLTYTQLGNSLQTSEKLDLDSHIRNTQFFAEYEWHPIDGLTITPGYKYQSFARRHEAVVNQTTLAPIDYSHTYTSNLPFLAVRYMISPNLSVYAQASKGFLAPTVSAYYTFNPATQSSIAPQTTVNYQTGVVYKSNDITASAAIYQITAKNFPLVTTTSGLQFYTNAGTARYQGIEAEASYKIVNGLVAYASGALISAKFIEGPNTGRRVGGAPSYTMAGGFVYDDQTYFGSLLHKVVGGSYGAGGQVPGNGFNKIGSYNTTDFVAGIRTDALKNMGFGQKAEIKIGVSNIFDHRNVTDISGDASKVTVANYATQTTLAYSFQASRTFYIAAKLDF